MSYGYEQREPAAQSAGAVPMDDFRPLAELASKVHSMLDNKFKVDSISGDYSINVEDEMAAFRNACHSSILVDFVSANKQNVDASLWAVHTRINGRFKQTLNRISNQEGNRSPVWRTTALEYVHFIKASQTAYRKFLRDLDARYPGISSLRKIAMDFKSSSRQSEEPPSESAVPEAMKGLIINLTCETLLHLGDLSRWRYVGHLDSRPSRWKDAAAFYRLAQEVRPASGFPQHQRGVLALADNKVFPAVYHLYQSLCAQKPHPEASQNLDRVLRKMLSKVSDVDSKLGPIQIKDMVKLMLPKDGGHAIATLRAWFLSLHVCCYSGVEFSAHDEMESEVLVRLSMALKDGTDLSRTLHNMVMVSIAAETVAFDKARKDIDPIKNAQAYFFFVRHNVRTFTELLGHLRERLEEHAREGVISNHETIGTGNIPPVSDVALQAIRLYSLWFTKNWSFLHTCTQTNQIDDSTSRYIKDLFTVLAPVLSAIFEQYALANAPAMADISYLLQEEETTLGFLPLQDEGNKDVWTRNGVLKSILRAEKNKEQIEMDHLIRLRDIFTRGVLVAQIDSSPFVLVGGKILFDEERAPSELFSPTPAREMEGEPFTPPPQWGDGEPMVMANSADDLDRLWIDGQADCMPDQKSNPPSNLPAKTSAPELVPIAPLTALAPQMLWLGPPYPAKSAIKETPVGWKAPSQLPWLLRDEAVDRIWKNDAPSVSSGWPEHPRFGRENLYSEGT